MVMRGVSGSSPEEGSNKKPARAFRIACSAEIDPLGAVELIENVPVGIERVRSVARAVRSRHVRGLRPPERAEGSRACFGPPMDIGPRTPGLARSELRAVRRPSCHPQLSAEERLGGRRAEAEEAALGLRT
jgi:hypothetical protein